MARKIRVNGLLVRFPTRAIDLDDVHQQDRKTPQRVMAGAKIVERNAALAARLSARPPAHFSRAARAGWQTRIQWIEKSLSIKLPIPTKKRVQ
jgi:hypothetical protein